MDIGIIGEAALSQQGRLEERVATFYGTYRESIYRFLVGQGLTPAIAQELTQDVFIDLFLALKKKSPVRSIQGWLHTVAARAAVDYWRREHRPIWVEMDSNPMIAESMSSQEPTPEVQAAEKEHLVKIAGALCKLPKEQRLCVQLRMQGLRYREIAKVLGVSTSTAADWLASAVERLREASHV